MAGLTEAKVRTARARDKRYKIADGNGLYLDVRTNGNKSWLIRVDEGGKRSWRAIGKYPIFSLDDARARAIEYKRGQIGLAEPAADIITFRTVAEELCAKLELGKADNTVRCMYGRLDIHVLPFIGDKDISKITTKDMYDIIEKMETRGIKQTAARVLQLCSRIFRHAILKEYCTNDPCYALRGTIHQNATAHRAALTDKDAIGQLMRDICSDKNYITKCVSLMTAYTFCRPSEVCNAEWSEFDLVKKIWIIPAERMKMRRDHMVPLTRQMIEILESMKSLTGHLKYVFASTYNRSSVGVPINRNTAIAHIRRLGYKSSEMTAHGFRGMASTILNEQGYNRDWIEMQLAHAPKDQVRGAYNRAQYWDGRCEMVQWYNDFLDELRDKE